MTFEIVSREEELGRISAFMRATEGLPGALVLEGDAGIGKSTLWIAGVEDARARGFRVLSSRPAEAERGLAYVGLGDLFEDILDDVLPGLPPPRRRALRTALFLEEGADALDPRALGMATRGALQLLAAAEPLLVAIDDLQWLDDASMRALAFALRRLRGRTLFLLARRLDRDGCTSEVEQALGAEHVQRLHIAPLSMGATQRLLQAQLARTFARPILLRLHDASGGNPFYALELARALDAEGASGDPTQPLPLPESLERVVRDRLADLPEPTARALLLDPAPTDGEIPTVVELAVAATDNTAAAAPARSGAHRCIVPPAALWGCTKRVTRHHSLAGSSPYPGRAPPSVGTGAGLSDR